ncbi:MAG: ester cyclase [Chloroflexota bacterium]
MRTVVEDIWNQGDLSTADAWFTEDYVNHGGLIPDLIHGPEAIKVSVALYRRAFPTFQIAIEELTTDEVDEVEFRWVAHGKPTVIGSPARKGGLRGISRCRLLDGKIAESWTAWDTRVALVRRWRL